MDQKKESAGGLDSTTAEAIHASKIIPSAFSFEALFTRFAAMLATIFRGLA